MHYTKVSVQVGWYHV